MQFHLNPAGAIGSNRLNEGPGWLSHSSVSSGGTYGYRLLVRAAGCCLNRVGGVRLHPGIFLLFRLRLVIRHVQTKDQADTSCR